MLSWKKKTRNHVGKYHKVARDQSFYRKWIPSNNTDKDSTFWLHHFKKIKRKIQRLSFYKDGTENQTVVWPLSTIH